MTPPPQRWRFRAVPENVSAARHAAAAYARWHGAADPRNVALAVSEAVTNCVLHAYAGADAPGEVEVVAQRHLGDGLEIRVCDDGHGMTPHRGTRAGGLGLSMLASLTERLEIRTRAHGGTSVLMIFAVVSSA